MNIHPSYVIQKENGLFVGKTSVDALDEQSAKLYFDEESAKKSCYVTEKIKTTSVIGDKIVIRRLYPTRWFQFENGLVGWTTKENEATIFSSKDVALSVAKEKSTDFRYHPERFCLESYENEVTLNAASSLWTTPAIDSSIPLDNAKIDNLITREDLLRKSRKLIEQKSIEKSFSDDVLDALTNYQDKIKRYESWSSIISDVISRKNSSYEESYIQFAQSIVQKNEAHLKLIDLLRKTKK